MDNKETRLKRDVVKMLETEFRNIYVYTPHDWTVAGIPDIIACWYGRMYGLELKIKGNNPGKIKLQRYILDQIKAAGGIGEVCYSVDEVRKVIRKGLDRIKDKAIIMVKGDKMNSSKTKITITDGENAPSFLLPSTGACLPKNKPNTVQPVGGKIFLRGGDTWLKL